jgi:hypothetical protein
MKLLTQPRANPCFDLAFDMLVLMSHGVPSS